MPSIFLDAYMRHAAQATDAPLEFAEACGLAGLSTVALRHRWLKNGIQPNLYMILSGPSTRDKKSTSVGLIVDVLSEVVPERIGPSDMTPEGLLAYMARKKPDPSGDEPIAHNTLVLPQREFGTLLAMMARSFGVGLQATLCDIYDGETVHRVRATSKPLKIEDPRVSIIGGCAYRMFDLHTRVEDWGSGFFARLNLVCGTPRDARYHVKPTTDLALKMQAIATLKHLHNQMRMSPMSLDVTQQAGDMYSFACSTEFADLGDDLDLRGHRERLLVAILKIALLYQIDDDPNADVGPTAMGKAIVFGRKLWQSGGVVWAMCNKDPKRRVLRRAVDIIARSPAREISRRELFRRSHLYAKDFNELITTLTGTGTAHIYGDPPVVKLTINPAEFDSD